MEPKNGGNGARILIVDDDQAVLYNAGGLLRKRGYEVTACTSAARALKHLRMDPPEVVLLDICMPEIDGVELSAQIKINHRGVEIVVMTGFPGERMVSDLRDLGVTYFVIKPWLESQLVFTIYAALHHTRTLKALQTQSAISFPTGRLIGASEASRRLRLQIGQFANASLPVLILGESGTGKELVALELHSKSERSAGPFHTVNCPSLGTVATSQLFGHARGAFTGAHRDNAGFVAIAQGGTLFLDEIGDLPRETQSELLRFLETGEYTPIGGGSPSRSDAQVVCATNRDLKAGIAEGWFREDLFYRVSALSIVTTPLRDNTEDIPLLVYHFLERFGNAENRTFHISPGALHRLIQHDWRGNVRELRNLLYLLTRKCPDTEISAADVVGELRIDGFAPRTYAQSKAAALLTHDRSYLSSVLVAAGGSLKKALEIAGMHKTNFYQKLKGCGLSTRSAAGAVKVKKRSSKAN